MKSLVLGLLAAEQDLISNLITSTEVLTFNWPAWDLLVSTGKSDDSPVVSFLLGRRTCLNNGFFANSFPFYLFIFFFCSLFAFGNLAFSAAHFGELLSLAKRDAS